MSKKIIATNPTARHNYDIIDTLEAGIVLYGTEIKSIRNGKVNLKDSYAGIKNGEVYLYSTFYFDDIFFRQADCLLEGFRQFCAAS